MTELIRPADSSSLRTSAKKNFSLAASGAVSHIPDDTLIELLYKIEVDGFPGFGADRYIRVELMRRGLIADVANVTWAKRRAPKPRI